MIKLHTPPEKLSIFSPVTLLASFGGSGFITPASGTWGSLAALPIATYILFNYSSLYLLYLSFTLFLIGIWVCREWLNAVGDQDNDPSMIVIDEAAGLSLTLAFAEILPVTLPEISTLSAFKSASIVAEFSTKIGCDVSTFPLMVP